ncbi:MAG: class III signal peptide-containing protein [Candidatus Micrarchaeota archaeon]
MDEKGQTSFEYIMLLGGVLMLGAIAYFMLRTNVIAGGEQGVNQSYNQYANATNNSDYIR